MKTEKLTASVCSTRRRFLQSAGAALAGGLGVKGVAASDVPDASTPSEKRDFASLPADFIYLNSGTEGSMPDCVISEFHDSLKKWASDPTTSYETDPAFGKRQELNREKVARFLGVGKNNIVLTDNTTMGLSMTLMGLNFRPDDRVVITNHEHTAVKSPLRVLQARNGLQIETRYFPPAEKLSEMNADELLEVLFPNIDAVRGSKALCVSHVYPTTGVRLPLRALRRKADELDIRYLVVDGAQAMGMIDLTGTADNVKNCDFYAAPGHKWLNAPPGTGVLYIRNANIRPPEFYPTLSQRMEQYSACVDDSETCFPVAEALQVRGCSNVPGFAAMIRAMRYVKDQGGSLRTEKHILGLSREIKSLILARAAHGVISPHTDSALLSGLTTFFPFNWSNPQQLFTDKKTADRVVRELLDENIQVRSIGFRNSALAGPAVEEAFAIRVSTGYFNTSEHVKTFGNALQQVLTRLG